MKKCPYCAEEIQEDAIICRFCGRDLPIIPSKAFAILKQKFKVSSWVGIVFIGLVAVILIVSLSVMVFSPEKVYSRSMKPILQELHIWLDGPVAQVAINLVNPYGHEHDYTSAEDYTNQDALNDYDFLSMLASGGAMSISETSKIQEEIRLNLAENLLPTFNAIASDGFEIITQLGGINPPDSIKIAHERVFNCIQYKVDLANGMIVFLNTGDESNIPSGNCDFFDESLQKISDFIK